MTIKTACPLDCYDGCSIHATVEQNGRLRLEGNPNHPITRGALCNRGRRLGARRDGEDRILYPMKREGGEWVQISWAQAYREIGSEIRNALTRYGHHAILHAFDWGSGALLKSLNQRFFYQLGGCTETVGSLCWEAGLEAQRYDFGQARSHAPDDMVRNSQGIVVWGRNVATTNVHMMPFIKEAQARGAKLAVVNPLATDVARRADLCVYPRPGTDALLALGVLRICRDQGTLDNAFVEHRSVGWALLSEHLEQYDPERVSRETNVPVDQIQSLADFYGRLGPVTTLLGIGMQRYAGGGNAIRAIDALAAATGHVGVPGGGVNYAQRGMSAFIDEDALTGRSGADVREFVRGNQALEIMQSDPPIQVLFVTRTNPLTQVPDSASLRKAYAGIGCKVVIDMYMTETAKAADYVLPCTSVLEEEDVTFTTMWHPYMSYIHPVVPPKGDAKPEWRIFAELAEELGIGERMAGTVAAWLNTALRPLFQHGVTLEQLREEGFVRLPVEEVPFSDGVFLTPSGKFEFASDTARSEGHSSVATYLPPRRAHGFGEHKYTLLTTHPRKHENSQRQQMAPAAEYPTVEVSRRIADARGIQAGDRVRVYNDKASLIGVAKVREEGHPYTVQMESGWSGQGVSINDFTDVDPADFGQQTTQYDCACSVELVERAGA
ncbi:molybdopterin-dependent oxidoreductase [Alicyclobacillus fastidiosus]|uniref:Molybdopterin-dependent oxidoreductase n=1 Tax=Alicyclobacillus fastidiosus TaxID=392011 RepID=A0ABY6ZGA8_9BACL|nr:molybdopterin-dependent oxidoreductase [Alicyclobacillus fastidiosus]WAH41944.1 molybdopterin-dependent oxidoreductase [Alicyclobacillus fastidiosus]